MSYTDKLIIHDFPAFAHKFHKLCRGGQSLDPDPYLLQAFAMAEDIAAGRITHAAISMPPGTAKSFIFAEALPAWILAHNPSATVMVVKRDKKQSRDSVRKILKIVTSQTFRRNFKARIDDNWKGAGDFGTTAGGSVYATSIKGGITGFRADVTIVDDPLSIKDANNEDEMEYVNETFDDEILSRARDANSCVIVVMHRLNENDLIGHVRRKGGYKELVLPLIAPKDKQYKTKYGVWHRKKGEPLRAGRYSKKELRDLAFKPSFRYLYQQGKGGGALLRVKARDFTYYDGCRDPSLPIVFSIDTAQKAGANSSRMVVQVWQTDGRHHYLLDVFAAICDYERLWGELARLVRRFPPSMILIEESSTGSALISQAKARLSYEVRAIVPRGSKSARFRPHFNTIRRGRVHVPTNADWAADWVEEIRAFPEGAYDDHVDALSMFLDFMATRPPLVPPKQHGGGRCVRAHDPGVFSCVSADGSRYFAAAARPRQPLGSPAAGGRASLETSTPRLVETRFGPVIIKPR